MAQVVPDDERSPHFPRGNGRRLQAIGDSHAPFQTRPRDDFPHVHGGGVDGAQQRTLDAYRVVVARRGGNRGVVIVDDIYAANEGDLPVHHGEFTVHAAQPLAAYRQRAQFAPIYQHAQVFDLERGQVDVDEFAAAKAIDQQMHGNAARCRAAQCVDDAPADVVEFENVGFEEDLALRPLDGGFECRKKLGAVFQQRDRVSVREMRPEFAMDHAGQDRSAVSTA